MTCQAHGEWGQGPSAVAGPTWPRKPYNTQLRQEGLGRLRQGSDLPLLHPTLWQSMWEQEREPQGAAPPHPSPLGERGNFLGQQGREPLGVTDMAVESSSSNPVLRKPSLSCLPSSIPGLTSFF